MIKRALRRTIDKFERHWSYDATYTREMDDTSPRAASRHSPVPGLLAAAVIAAIWLAAPAAAQVPVEQAAVNVYTMSPGRIGAIVGVVLGLIGAVSGGRALTRSAARIGARNGRRGAIVALVLGPIGLAIGGLVVATAGGGVGTGNGVGGGVVAMVVGLIGMALGGLAMARSRRTG